jgi:hypothetical protein
LALSGGPDDAKDSKYLYKQLADDAKDSNTSEGDKRFRELTSYYGPQPISTKKSKNPPRAFKKKSQNTKKSEKSKFWDGHVLVDDDDDEEDAKKSKGNDDDDDVRRTLRVGVLLLFKKKNMIN